MNKVINPMTGEVLIVDNAFCPTGQGGGRDPSCGKGGMSDKEFRTAEIAKMGTPPKPTKKAKAVVSVGLSHGFTMHGTEDYGFTAVLKRNVKNGSEGELRVDIDGGWTISGMGARSGSGKGIRSLKESLKGLKEDDEAGLYETPGASSEARMKAASMMAHPGRRRG